MQTRIVLLISLLLLMLRPAFGQTELIVNGGFENSTASIAPWLVNANPSSAANVESSVGAYAGSSECLLLANGFGYSQDVYQTITFPTNLIGATFSFWYNIVSTDPNMLYADTTLSIKLTDLNQNVLTSIGPASNLNATGGYVQYSGTFVTNAGSGYVGKSINVHFISSSDSFYGGYTQFYIDNVSMQVATTANIPANDNFSNAIALTGTSVVQFDSNTYASKETGEPNIAGNTGGHSLWWTWTAPANGIVGVNTAGSSFATVLGVYTGSAVNALTQVAANNGGGTGQAALSFKATAGTTYAIGVDGYNGATGSVILSLGFANDITPPTVAITSPAAGATVTNSTILVSGTANDNVAVATVNYRLENSAGTNTYQAANGTTNWSATVTGLLPGLNTVRVFATDTSSNVSSTLARTYNYVILSPLTLSVSGRGTVSGATNGQLLKIGYPYKLTATPAAGFSFANWSGGYSTNSAALNFIMQANLAVQANFYDSTIPTITVSTPIANQHWSNNTFIVTGKAADNVAVSNVFYNFNHTGWTDAGTTNNWTNWSSAAITLSPGTNNSVSAYAVDTAGNFSKTNTVNWVYILSAPLSVSINGRGTISPNYTNTELQISNTYSLTATPAAGFAFANWTDNNGNIFTNRVRTFQMVSNLTFTVNFVDIAPPTVTITSPTVNQRWSNNTFTVTGKAADNVAVSNVFYNLNHAGWAVANTTNYWTNWTTGPVTLIPGTNTLSTYAVDTSGNPSKTNGVSWVYILSAPLAVSTTGRGTIAPNYNNAQLQIGATYTMTATPAPGFAFTNWSDGGRNVITNKPALRFSMVSNLVFFANFADITPPTLSITNLPASGNVSNFQFTAAGKAADNVGVQNVFYNLNNMGWSNAITSNNWTNWLAGLELTPGTNELAVFAQDAAGNSSKTNTARLVYVVNALLTVSTNGNGSVNPVLNGTLLHLGQNYTLTAKAGIAATFTNWTDGSGNVLTNKPVLTFMMSTNLLLTANFVTNNAPALTPAESLAEENVGSRSLVDVTPPTVVITSPTVNQHWSNDTFTVTGKAADNIAVSNVLYNFDNAGWTLATTVNNWTNWTAAVTLTPGTNTISTYAVDTSGNRSKTNTVNWVYIVSAPLAVSVTGLGSLSPDYNNAQLQIGASYSMTATPVAGFAFTNWTDGAGNILTNKAVLRFVMASNLSFTANFVDVTRPTLTVVSPLNLLTVSNSLYLASGRAADNFAVASVLYQLNTSGWNVATTTNNWTNWVANLNLVPGTNYLSAYAVDTSGNLSSTNSVKLIYSTAYTTLNGLAAVVMPDSGSSFNMGFGYNTFIQSSADTNNINGVGGYIYTQLSQTSALLTVKYLAPMLATNGGTPGLMLTFSAPGVARFINTNILDTNDLDTGGIMFTSVPVNAPPYVLGRTIYNINSQGGGQSIYFYPNLSGYQLIDLGAHTTNFSWSYAYDTYGPVGALVELVNKTNTIYYVMNFTGTNYGTTYEESYTPKGVYTGASQGVFGLSWQRAGGNAPTNLVGRMATVTSDNDSFVLTFPDGVNFTQLNATNNTETNGIGSYVYLRTGTNAASLTLNYTTPAGVSATVFQFASTNFAIFTNADTTLGTAVFQ